MQTIDDSLFQVSIDENGAKMVHLVSETDNFDYLGSQDAKEGLTIAFPVLDHEKSWISDLPWTVVDKGDTRVSLTVIDTPASYKHFPYHFEVMTTYELEGNQVKISFYLKNSSHKKMPFALGFVLPINWQAQTGVNKISLKGQKHEIDVSSEDFKLQDKNGRILASTDDLELDKENSRKLSLTLALH